MKAFAENIIKISFLVLITSLTSTAQDCYWLKHFGGSYDDVIEKVVTDNEGNSYVSGWFSSYICYLPSDTLYCNGNNDIFIAKYNSSGTEVWVRQFYAGWSNETVLDEHFMYDDITITGMVFDSLDQTLLVTGTFFNHMMLPNSMVVYGRHFDVFVMKMDLDGNILWVRTGGCEFEDKSMSIAYDSQENVYVTGVNRFPATFGNTTIAAGGFMAKYDHTGELLWVLNKFQYSNDYDYYTDAPPQYSAFSNDQLIIYGKSLNSILVIDTITLGGFDNGSSFLAAFTTDGSIKWLRKVGGGNDYPNGQISTDSSNNIFLAGIFHKMGVFGNDTLYNTSDDYDCFLTKLTRDGLFQWAVQGHATGFGWGSVSLCDAAGNVYTGGEFNDTITFGEQILVSQTDDDIFIASYTSNGICRGAVSFSQGNVSGMAFDLNGNLIFGGNFCNSLTIGSSTITSFGEYDGFTAKCSPITSTKESPAAPANTLLIYANPNTGKCNITIPDEFRHEDHLTLFIYDSKGTLIQKASIERTEEIYRLDIRAQAAGIYQAVLTNGKKNYAGKIVFEKR